MTGSLCRARERCGETLGTSVKYVQCGPPVLPTLPAWPIGIPIQPTSPTPDQHLTPAAADCGHMPHCGPPATYKRSSSLQPAEPLHSLAASPLAHYPFNTATFQPPNPTKAVIDHHHHSYTKMHHLSPPLPAAGVLSRLPITNATSQPPKTCRHRACPQPCHSPPLPAAGPLSRLPRRSTAGRAPPPSPPGLLSSVLPCPSRCPPQATQPSPEAQSCPGASCGHPSASTCAITTQGWHGL